MNAFTGMSGISSLLSDDQLFNMAQPMSGLTQPMDIGGLTGLGKGLGRGILDGDMFRGMNGIQAIGAGLGGLQSLSNMFLGFKALSQASKQFKAQRGFANANLENQTKSYNTALEDRARTRAAIEDQSSEQSQAYIDRNRLNYKKI